MEIDESSDDEPVGISKNSRLGSAKRGEQPSDRDIARTQTGSRHESHTKSPKFDEHLKQLETPSFGDHLKDMDASARAGAGRDSRHSTHSVHERPPSGAHSTHSHHSRDHPPADGRPPSHHSHHSHSSRHSHHSHHEPGDRNSGEESWESGPEDAAAAGAGHHPNHDGHPSHSGSRNSRRSKEPPEEKPRFVVADGAEWDPSYEQQVTALNRFLGLGVNPDAVWKEPALEREQEFELVFFFTFILFILCNINSILSSFFNEFHSIFLF